ncbi:hypothetical protein PIROE2DRAFT_10638 [Piromyces sp. E2]|nr:hypothetical protein PIROE2DRAFT_10638 [Piromyces sp. E2]|eukprot:OUM62949.1 hypothetical protein PIROE2DRAFT_10638 [Piromyces sp. E2]
MRISPLPNKLNEIKERNNIKFDSVVTTKLSHESLMLSFNEFLTSDPAYGTNVKFLCPIDTTCSFKCLCSALSICSSLKAKIPPRRNVKIDPSSVFKTTTNTNDPDNSKIKTFRFFGPEIMRHCKNITNKVSDNAIGISPFDKAFIICCVAQIPAKGGIIKSLDSAYKLIYELRSWKALFFLLDEFPLPLKLLIYHKIPVLIKD